MRKNQRSTHDYRKYKPTKIINDEIELKEKVNQELKSLECSSVQQVQQTNQSYQMSWLEKLVNNMDDENKYSNLYNEQINRNFSRKGSVGNYANFTDTQKSIENYARPRSTYSLSKNQSKFGEYTPYSKISQKYQEPVISHLRNEQNQRIKKDYFYSAQKYKTNKNHVFEDDIKKKDEVSKQSKDMDLNQSAQSYGRIKKVNKYRQQNSKPLPKSNIQNVEIVITRPYSHNNSYNKKQRFATEEINIKKSFDPENLLQESRNRINTNANAFSSNSKSQELNFLKKRSSGYNILIQDSSSNHCKDYKNYENSLPKYNIQKRLQEICQKQKEKPKQKQFQKRQLKQQDFKMDEMAKRLNMVLQNISKKSKMISQTQHEEKLSVNQCLTPQLSSQNFSSKQLKRVQNYDSQDSHNILIEKINEYKRQHAQKRQQQLRKSSKQSKSYITPPTRAIQNQHQNRSSRIQQQGHRQRAWQKQRESILKYKQKQATKQKSLEAYALKYRQNQKQLNIQKSGMPSKFPQPAHERHYQSLKYQQKPKYGNHLTPFQQQQKNKYQMMKRSLGMSKHIPQQIILQESSSQINSEISPRTQFLNRQFKAIFDALDKNGSGQLSRTNCAVEIVNDQIKYLFGGILSRIKYKNERIFLKNFLQECQNISKQFQFQQLKQVLNKSKNITNFKLHQKDTQSQRWNNQTNYQSESKRSSDRSEVVKRYEFIQDQKDMQKIIKINQKDDNRQKVHWASSQYTDSVANVKYQVQKNSVQNEKHQHRRDKNLLEQKKQSKNLYNPYSEKSQYNKKKQVFNQGEVRVQKQNIKIKVPEMQKQKKDFEKMCENLNNKLNNYLITIKQRELSGHHIPLQFSELSKHLSVNK